MHLNRIVVFAVAITLLATFLSSRGGEKRAESSEKDHDFGDKVLYVVTKPKDAKSDCGYSLYEKVKVARLGDRSFLVGQIPDYGERPEFKAAAGKTVWIPVSDIVQITEFETIADAKKYFETVRKPVDKEEP
ncbi:MAG TPA: hypothetical protein VMF69_05095 [Gemmataceae bacterium]|nr:hypothetical protein [Gemmataceae bacterium]